MKYYFSPDISYATFKKVNDKISPPRDIYPIHSDRVLWRALRDRNINIFIDTEQKDEPIIVSVKPIPRGATIITSKKKTRK